MKGVLLAAGKGTRMMPLTARRPKPLVPVCDRPIIEHILCGARDAGIDHFCLIVGYKGDMLQERLGDGSRLGMRIEYVWQEQALGTGAATLLAEEFVGEEPFFLGWGDILVPPGNYGAVVEAYREPGAEAVLGLNYVDDPWEGAAVYVRDGFIDKIIEKPAQGASTTNYNNAGLFVFRPDVFDRLRECVPSARGEIEMPDAIQAMLGDGVPIRGVPIEGYWSDVARPRDALRMSARVMDERRRPSPVFVDPSAQVGEGVALKPPVYIGPNVTIKSGVIGPNVSALADVTIGEQVRIYDAMLMAGATVRDGATLHRAFVEEGATVQEGSNVAGRSGVTVIVDLTGDVLYAEG
jgi:NDP-sugar pyrophosphorylase family protein